MPHQPQQAAQAPSSSSPSSRPSALARPLVVLFMWVVMQAYAAVGYIPTLVMERPLFVRERSDGLYLASTYLASKLVEELSIAAIASCISSVWIFYCIRLQVGAALQPAVQAGGAA